MSGENEDVGARMPDANRVQIDNAIRALAQKKPAPEIDFTLHTMEDNTQVSTLERVCKGKQNVMLREELLLTRL
jgi:serine/threonine-protein phosphatase 2B catalytic subunit